MQVRSAVAGVSADVPAGLPDRVAGAAGRRRLLQPRRVTDRAEGGRPHADVIADRLQALEDRLPLFPVELPQKRPQPLDERILEQRLPIRFRDEEAVQPDV